MDRHTFSSEPDNRLPRFRRNRMLSLNEEVAQDRFGCLDGSASAGRVVDYGPTKPNSLQCAQHQTYTPHFRSPSTGSFCYRCTCYFIPRIAKPFAMVCALFKRKAPELRVSSCDMHTRSTRVTNFQPNIPKNLVFFLEVESGSDAHQ